MCVLRTFIFKRLTHYHWYVISHEVNSLVSQRKVTPDSRLHYFDVLNVRNFSRQDSLSVASTERASCQEDRSVLFYSFFFLFFFAMSTRRV